MDPKGAAAARRGRGFGARADGSEDVVQVVHAVNVPMMPGTVKFVGDAMVSVLVVTHRTVVSTWARHVGVELPRDRPIAQDLLVLVTQTQTVVLGSDPSGHPVVMRCRHPQMNRSLLDLMSDVHRETRRCEQCDRQTADEHRPSARGAVRGSRLLAAVSSARTHPYPFGSGDSPLLGQRLLDRTPAVHPTSRPIFGQQSKG